MSVKDRATEWWGETTTRGECVVSSSAIPGQREREFLVKEGLLSRATKGHWILKKPEDDLEEVFPLLYWQVVERALGSLEHWSIRGQSAVSVLSGDQSAPSRLLARTKKKTNYAVPLPLGLCIALSYDPTFDERLVRKEQVANAIVPVDVPERVLVDIGKLRDGPEVRSFVLGADFDPRIVEAIYATKPRPIVFKRLVEFAREVGRQELADALARIVETHTHYRVVRRPAPREVRSAGEGRRVSAARILRQEEQFDAFADTLARGLGREIPALKKRPLRELLEQAREHKRYDTYHSTTLEGYRITPEEVDALLSGVVPEARKAEAGRYVDEVRNRMAILGYSEAFDFVLGKAESDFGHPKVTEELVKDIYYHLFKPSADAGIIDYLSLTTYRNIPAFIRGTPYAPPSHEKVPDLMTSFVSRLAGVKDPVVSPILAHYWFVTIHPYLDGNGRTGRLLMDYLLVGAGYPWVTIRVEERAKYFDSLKASQVDGDILPLGKFVVEAIGRAGSA